MSTKQTVITIPIKDLAKQKLCQGSLFFCNREGKRFLLKSPGSWIEDAFIKKHATNQTNFEYHLVTDHELMNRFRDLFKELKYSLFERDLKDKSFKIIQEFNQLIENDHLLNFSIVCFEEFNSVSESVLSNLYEVDEALFKKTLYSAALTVIVAMSNGYFSYAVLKDFYNIAVGLDLGLSEKNYSYFIAQASNFESQIPGSGLSWLESSGASELEIEIFKNHPIRSYEIFNEHVELAYPEFKEILLYQHELANGSGFPRGIRKHQILGWESVVILANSILEIGEDSYAKEIKQIIKKYADSHICDLPVKKTYQRLLAALNLSTPSQIEEVG